MYYNNFYLFLNIKSLSLDKFVGFKNFFNITSKSIIAKTRQIKLLMFCFTFLRKVKAKKRALS